MNKPFLLKPAGKDYLWGGRRLNDEFAKGIDLSPLAETWECSTHPDGESIVVSGEFQGRSLKEVLDNNTRYLGRNCEKSGELPILIKFIDADKDLSVQVHPTDAYADTHEGGQRGKTEMWYVLDAAKNANLIYGLRQKTDRETFRKAAEEGKLFRYLNRIPAKKDDVFFIEAGTIHAIGAGVLVAEIQENSNLTYRLYDYDRTDKDGKKRELQLDKALEVANLDYVPEPSQPLRVLRYRQGMATELLANCRYFQVHRMLVNTERRQQVSIRADEMSFRVLLCIHGCGTASYEDADSQNRQTINLYKGDCLFVPADSVEISMHGQMAFLDVRA